MEIIYIIAISIFNTILAVGSIIYFHCRLNKMDLKIEHEIKNQKHTQSLLSELQKTNIFFKK
jgi:hypothetical protein